MKYLTDAQAPAIVVRMLRALGWDVETVYDHGLDQEQDDARIVAWAREHERVLISFDLFRGATGVRVVAELRERGGRVLTIGGGREQPPERALGRRLFHQPEWLPFFEQQEGRVFLSDIKHNCRLVPRQQASAEATAAEPRFAPFLRERESAQRPARAQRRARLTAIEQAPLAPAEHDEPTS